MFKPASTWSDTALLVKLYWTIDRRGDSRQSRIIRLITLIILIGVAIAISFGVGVGAGAVITNPALPFVIRLGTVPGLLLTMVLVGTLISGINQAIRALYLTNDMELLFSAPIRTEAVLTAKLIGRLPTMVLVTLILTIPALIGFGIATGLGPAFYVAGSFALLMAPLFGISAGALLAMFIVRILPAQRVSEYLGAASIILGVLMAILFQLPRFLRSDDGEGLDPGALEAISGLIESVENIPLPSMWAGQGLVELAQGRIVSALSGLALYLLLTAGLFFVTLLLANRLYLTSWLRMQGSGITRSGYVEEAGVFGSSSTEAGIASKDWLLRLRDARQLAGLVSGLVFAIFFGYIMLRPGSNEGLMAVSQNRQGNILDTVFSTGVVISGVILYAGWVTFQRAALTALSIEGRSFYILKAAPVPPQTVFRSKVLGLVVPYALISLLMLVAAWFFLRFSALWIPYAWFCLLIIGYGMITISTTMGFLYPRLDWDDPRRMTSNQAGWRNLVAVLIYGLLSLAIALLSFVAANIIPQFALLYVLLGLVFLAGMAWLVERWSVRQVAKKWANIELPG
jgi:ABC-2 type transport system permease protein